MRRTILYTICAILSQVILFSFVTVAHAQFKAGIQGTVKDSAGGLLPAARVTLTNLETGKSQETSTSDEGFYRLSELPPGRYKLVVEKEGYKQKVYENLTINAEA